MAPDKMKSQQWLLFEYLGESFEVSPGMIWYGQGPEHAEPQWLFHAELRSGGKRDFVLRLCRFDRMVWKEQ